MQHAVSLGNHILKILASHPLFISAAIPEKIYPSITLHQVRPVTQGTRTCSFFWIQSMVQDPGQRTLLYELDQSI